MNQELEEFKNPIFMAYNLEIPARINLLGNPGDSNEGDFAVLSTAINLHAGAHVEYDHDLIFELTKPHNQGAGQRLLVEQHPLNSFPLPYNQRLDLLKGAANRMYAFSPEFREKVESLGFRISVWSHVPRQSDLGGSSLLVLLVLAALRACYDLDFCTHNDYILAELAHKVEYQEMRITSGFADRYVPMFGGLAYVDFRDKLFQREIGREPFATYEHLGGYITDLPLVYISSLVRNNNDEAHTRLRPQYLEEYKTWLEKWGEPPPMVASMQAVWETAWRGKVALLQGDLQTLGALMNENHRLVDEMMKSFGIEDGAGWENNLLIKAARKNGALGAKLTGAGRGGSVFALVRPGDEGRISSIWEAEAIEAGLKNIWIYRPRIAQQGLVVRKDS